MNTEHQETQKGSSQVPKDQAQPELSEEKTSQTTAKNTQKKVNAKTQKRRFRPFKWLLSFICILLLILIISSTALWVWGGKEGSLSQAISLAQRFVPIVGRSLSTDNVTGSLRHGGSIAYLRWKQDGVDIQVSDITLNWDLSNIFNREIKIDHLVLNQAHLIVTPKLEKEEEKTKALPPQQVGIPFVTIDAPDIQINKFIYGQEEQGIIVTQTKGRYRYDSRAHHLLVDSMHFANIDFTAQIILTGNMPELNAKIQAQGISIIPGSEQQARIQADAQAQGPLTKLIIQAQAYVEQAQIANEGLVENEVHQPSEGNTLPPSQIVSAQPDTTRLEETTKNAFEVLKNQSSTADLNATLTPWDELILPQAELNLQNVNLSIFWPTAPQSLLTGSAQVSSVSNNKDTQLGWKIALDIDNHNPGALDENKIPLTQLHAMGLWEDGAALLQKMQASIGDGTLQAKGRFELNPKIPAPQLSKNDLNAQHADTHNANTSSIRSVLPPYTWQLTTHINNIDLHDLYSKLETTKVKGVATAEQNDLGIAYYVKIDAASKKANPKQNNARIEQLHAQGIWTDETLNFDTILVKTSNSLITGSGEVLIPESTENIIDHIQTNGKFVINAPGVEAEVRIEALTSTQGSAQAILQLSDASKTLEWIKRIPITPKEIQDYTALGGINSHFQIQNGWRTPLIKASLDTPSFFLSRAAHNETPEKVLTQLKDTHITLNGTPQQAHLKAQINAIIEEYAAELDLESTGGSPNLEDLHLKISQLSFKLNQLPAKKENKQKPLLLAGVDLKAPVNIVWNNSVEKLDVSPSSIALNFAQADNKNAPFINWEKLSWQRNGDFISKGKLSEFPIQWLTTLTQSRFADIDIGGNLMLEGNWQIQIGSKLDFLAEVKRSRGDLEFTQDNNAFSAIGKPQTYKAGIKNLNLKIYNQGNNVHASFVWDSEYASSIDVAVATTLSHQNNSWSISPDAPLSGHAKAQIPHLDALSRLAPTGWRLGGRIELDAQIDGSISSPSLKGKLLASNLGLRSVLDGIAFMDGQAKLDFDGNRVNLSTFSLKGEGNDGGQVSGQGFVEWSNHILNAQLKLTLDKFKASAHRDRLIILSGNTDMSLHEHNLNINGALSIDKALIILANSSAPQLDSDVVILGETPVLNEDEKSHVNVQTASPGITPQLKLTLNTGQDFRVQGFGLQTYLRGVLSITNSGFQPWIIGQINTEDGRFRAYGQKLNIETGQIIFSGPYNNPTLNILAIRPQTQETVGVKVTGTATHPKVSLYSASGLSDSDILSWLLLGRAPSAGGAESAALQQAALALLSGDSGGISETIATTLGLDEISVGGSSSSSNQDDDSLSGTTITIGKRLSDKFYVSYEQGLSGASSAFFVFYQISKRLTLRAEAGENTAADIIYSFSFN